MSAGNYDFYDDNVGDENGDDDDDDDDDDVEDENGETDDGALILILLKLADTLYTVSEHFQIHAKKAAKGEPYSVPACYKVSLYLSQAEMKKAADMADTWYTMHMTHT